MVDRIFEDSKRCEFTWPGKQHAILEVDRPTAQQLLPRVEHSVEWGTTQNLYIEGDNLAALKLLHESHREQVKLIYIDPPYNTGKQFIYGDKFKGQYHDEWLTMIYPRLILARKLLREDGAIFISIDDHEVHHLRYLCDEVFGEENFVAQIIWERSYAPVNLKKHFSNNHEYIIGYAKDIDQLVCHGLPRDETANNRYRNPDQDPRGPWQSDNLSVGPIIPKKVYEIVTPSGRRVLPPSGYCWRYTKETFQKKLKDNRIWFGVDGNNVPRIKRFLAEVKTSITPMTIWNHRDVGHSQSAKQQLNELFSGNAVFDYPKPVKLIRRILGLYTASSTSDLVVDFFSGSATTAHAVLESNALDNGNRRYIMVQLPVPTAKTSTAYAQGYSDICQLGKERIRRAGRKIKKETGSEIDYGFRVFRVTDS